MAFSWSTFPKSQKVNEHLPPTGLLPPTVAIFDRSWGQGAKSLAGKTFLESCETNPVKPKHLFFFPSKSLEPKNQYQTNHRWPNRIPKAHLGGFSGRAAWERGEICHRALKRVSFEAWKGFFANWLVRLFKREKDVFDVLIYVLMVFWAGKVQCLPVWRSSLVDSGFVVGMLPRWWVFWNSFEVFALFVAALLFALLAALLVLFAFFFSQELPCIFHCPKNIHSVLTLNHNYTPIPIPSSQSARLIPRVPSSAARRCGGSISFCTWEAPELRRSVGIASSMAYSAKLSCWEGQPKVVGQKPNKKNKET